MVSWCKGRILPPLLQARLNWRGWLFRTVRHQNRDLWPRRRAHS